MEVIRAESAGACYGVKRALDMATDCAHSGAHTQTLGPLIHNPYVVEQLAEEGVEVAYSVDDIVGDTVIFRSHGVTPATIKQVKLTGVEIIDATCPHVLRAQRAAFDMAKDGMTVLVVGEKDHPEVQGLKAWAEDAGGIVAVVAYASEIPDSIQEPLGVVVQTTQPKEVLDGVLDALERRGLHAQVCNTICNATTKRQNAARTLASHVDAMVVIGGKNSSNTTRLYEICKSICPHTVHIELAHELKKNDFSQCKVIGITAGASTPEEHISAVENTIRAW